MREPDKITAMSIEIIRTMRLRLKGLQISRTSHNVRGSGSYRAAGFVCFIAAILVIICPLIVGVATADETINRTPKILILNSYHKEFKWTDDLVSSAKQFLSLQIQNPDFYIEYMDTKRMLNDEYLQLIHQTMRFKYSKVKLDVIISTDDNALQFLLKYGAELFGQTPVVFCGVNHFQDSMLQGKTNFTGLLETLDYKLTIDLALKLHPKTRRVMVITDNTPTGFAQNRTIAAVVSQYKDLTFEYLSGEDLSTEELVEKLKALPANSIVLLATWSRDKTGAYYYFDKEYTDTLISFSSTAPIYNVSDAFLGSGTVGGKMLSSRSHGRRAAEIAIRILNGEKPSDIPIRIRANNPYMFDYTQLKRWRINIAALPENSILINEPQSFYYLYKTQIWTMAAVITVLSAMILILTVNILRRRQAEKALAHAERVYREAIGYAHGVPYQVRFSDDKYLFIGLGAEKLIGVPVENLTRKVFCELIDDVILTDPDVSMDLVSYRKEFEKGMISRYQADLHLCTPAGHKKWLSDCSVPIRDDKTGEVFGAMGVLQDITQRKRAEKALQDSEVLYRSLVDVMPQNMYRVDKQGRILFGNKTYLTTMGMTLDECLGKTSYDFFPKELADKYRTDDQRVMETGEILGAIEKHEQPSTGKMLYVHVVKAPTRDAGGNITGIQGIFWDVTEQKQAEEELKISEEKYRTQFEESLDAIFVCNAQTGIIIDCNDAASKLVGREKSELIGRHQTILHPPENVNGQFSKTFKQHLHKKAGQVIETKVITKDGELKDVAIKASLFELKDKKMIQGIFHDVTEQKLAEKKLLDYQNQLKSLASKLSLAEERERRRIAMELHDRISQSLVISKIELEALRASTPSESLANALNKICDSLGQTIEDTSSLTFDLSSPVLYELGFEAAVKEWLVEQVEEKYGIATEYKKDSQLKFLEEEIGILLFRTVRELLINVVKHANANKVKVSTYKQDSQACVIVEDDGVGFDPAEIVPVPGRAGNFGLFSIRERLAHLDGRLEIKAASSRGTKITVTVPLKRTIVGKVET